MAQCVRRPALNPLGPCNNRNPNLPLADFTNAQDRLRRVTPAKQQPQHTTTTLSDSSYFSAVSQLSVTTPGKDHCQITRRPAQSTEKLRFFPNITTFHLHTLTAPTGHHYRPTITKFHPRDTPSIKCHDVRCSDRPVGINLAGRPTISSLLPLSPVYCNRHGLQCVLFRGPVHSA